MARSRGRQQSRRSGPRRRLFWAREQVSFVMAAGNVATTNDLLATFQTAYDADLFGFTVTRILGNFTMYASSAGSSGAGTLSVGIRTDDQSQVEGATEAEQAARVPAQDPFADWMYATNRTYQQFATAPTDAERAAMQAQNRWEIDLHSQRRLDELGQSLYLYVSGMVATTFSADLHILCKRP